MVVGPVVIIIGLALAQTAVQDMPQPTGPLLSSFPPHVFQYLGKGLFQVIPILLGIVSGYIFSMVVQYGGFLPNARNGFVAPMRLRYLTILLPHG